MQKATLKNTHAALPIVAQAWGDKLGVKVVVGGHTAMTDGKTIVIPNVNEDFGSLEPIWGYLLHEAQHVKHTDFGVERRGEFFSSLVNIFEDVRIERDAIAQYAGAKSMLDACATYMMDQMHYVPVDANESPARIVGSFCLYYGQLVGVGQSFLQPLLDSTTAALRSVMPDLEKPLVAILNEAIKHMRSTQDAAEYSRKVMELMQDLMDEDKEQSTQPNPQPGEQGQSNQATGDQGDTDAGGEQNQSQPSADGSSDKTPGNQGGDSDSESQDKGEGAEQGQDSRGGDTKGNEAGDARGQGSGKSGDADPEGNQGKGDQSVAGQNQNQSPQNATASNDEGDDGEAGDNCSTSGQGKSQEKPTAEGQGGQAQPGKGAGDKQRNALEQALNAGAGQVLEDVRDSLKRDLMSQHDESKLGPSIEQTSHIIPCIGAARYRRAIGASVALRRQFAGLLQSDQQTADRRARRGRLGNGLSRVVQGDTKVFVRRAERIDTGAAVHILVDRSGSMATSVPSGQSWLDIATESAATMFAAIETQPNTSCGLTFFDCSVHKAIKQGQRLAPNKEALGVSEGGSTSTGRAIVSVLGDLLQAKEERKLLFVVTDGDPDCPEQLREAISLAEQHGVEVHGVGICLPSVKRHFAQSIVINDVGDLRQELLKLARKSL